MSVNTNIYDKKFFTNTIKFEKSSAKAVVDILVKYFKPRSVVDIGCGCGIYLAEFAKRGIEILGYDGSPAALANSLVGDKIKLHDLCKPLNLNKKFDLCLSVEIAEHLPTECADVLIQTLTNASDTVVFTAATPGQGPRSIGHINEQPHEYWVEKFKEMNFSLEEKLTIKIKTEMEANKVVWWVTKNLLIFKNRR
jgi:2-polyprenyl-3-methyl-5-hydroxy-6-metoxy-1,4-benzoquinol methylase